MENEEIRLKILGLLDTLQNAAVELYGYTDFEDKLKANELVDDIRKALHIINANTLELEATDSRIKLSLGIESIEHSLTRSLEFLNKGNLDRFQNKIEFELIPLLKEAFAQFYFWGYLINQENSLRDYLQNDRAILYENSYIDQAVSSGEYKYDIAFVVLAYNKLDYTKRCVESLLNNIPSGCNYELILINHGSTDGTKEYFESINPTKQLDIKVNGGGMDAYTRIVESEFAMQISNDVIIMPGAIENMIACIKSDPKIAWVVPTTPNVSNFQTIEAKYNNFDEMMAFVKINNILNPYRWEQRVRLCNPISLFRTETFFAKQGSGLNGYIHSDNVQSFPDDRVSLLLRRAGYKLMLAKDSFCHHFGSITLKNEIQLKGETEFYEKGRKEFLKAFGIDPWGIGFCYDSIFCNKYVEGKTSHTDVLGISCGIGSNSLKIKEQLKEYCHNTDVTLFNITDQESFLLDLKGISDFAYVIKKKEALKKFIEGKRFDYIIWEDSFMDTNSFPALLETMLNVLDSDGQMLMKINNQNMNWIKKNESRFRSIDNSWIVFQK